MKMDDELKAFIKDIVDKELALLTDEDKAVIRECEDVGDLHFSYGLYLRNEYKLWQRHFGFWQPDDLSEEIIKRIKRKLK